MKTMFDVVATDTGLLAADAYKAKQAPAQLGLHSDLQSGG